jgi:hypothetical protein
LGDAEFGAGSDGRRFDRSLPEGHAGHASASKSSRGFGEAGEKEEPGGEGRPDRALLVGEDVFELGVRSVVGALRRGGGHRR